MDLSQSQRVAEVTAIAYAVLDVGSNLGSRDAGRKQVAPVVTGLERRVGRARGARGVDSMCEVDRTALVAHVFVGAAARDIARLAIQPAQSGVGIPKNSGARTLCYLCGASGAHGVHRARYDLTARPVLALQFNTEVAPGGDGCVLGGHTVIVVPVL